MEGEREGGWKEEREGWREREKEDGGRVNSLIVVS